MKSGLGNKLKRIVFIVADVSTIGGISSRTKRVLSSSNGRSVEYLCVTAKNERNAKIDKTLCFSVDSEKIYSLMSKWTPEDTVFIVSNNSLSIFPENFQDIVLNFAVAYICAGQMSYMIQDSMMLANYSYVRKLRATKIISFSDGDIAFQRQLGIHGQVKSFVPVEQRGVNNFHTDKNIEIAYVGRIDFHAKDCMRLIEIACLMKKAGEGVLKVYTTDGTNSPGYKIFVEKIKHLELGQHVDIVLNCTDKSAIFDKMAVMLLPSKKESFGNSVVEAMSYGVPVIAASYAPGPSEIIENNISGYLLDSFNAEKVLEIILSLDKESLSALSEGAFERHKIYKISVHLDQLENISECALSEFDGVNRLPVFPELKIVEAGRKSSEELKSIRRSIRFRAINLLANKLNNFISFIKNPSLFFRGIKKGRN